VCIHSQARYWAFGEQTLPYELDPVTLETRGEYDFHGKLNHLSPFAAHAQAGSVDRPHAEFRHLLCGRPSCGDVYEFDAQGHQIRRRRHPLRYPHSNHDFGVTPNHVVFFLRPAADGFRQVLGRRVGDGVTLLAAGPGQAGFW